MKSHVRHFRALVRIVVLALPLTLASALPHASASVPTTIGFNYTGAAQQWTVPAEVHSITVEAWGAASRDSSAATTGCVPGGYAQRTISVSPGEVLGVYVGGMGGGWSASYNGGFNGGGAGGWSGSYAPGGGGATDVRQGGLPTIYGRVVVAGGAGGTNSCSTPTGGAGGGLIGGGGSPQWGCSSLTCPYMPGQGGSQVTGGAGGVSGLWVAGPGTFGQGGNGGTGSPGGGGGWFGGGGGGESAGGGGGSGFAPGGLLQNGGNLGHGRLTITYQAGMSTAPAYVAEGNYACTTGAATRVDRVRTDDGTFEYEVDIHHTSTEVQVCTTVRDMNSGQEIWSKDIVVDKTWDPDDIEPPVTPPTVEDEAPDGEAPGSPCTPGGGPGWGGGSENARAYARTGTNSSDEPVICVGFRSPAASRHVRVTVH